MCRCLYETIRYWITRIGGSWEELELALNSDRVQRHDTAETIRRDYITGNDYTCNCMCCHYYCIGKKQHSHVLIKESKMCQSSKGTYAIINSITIVCVFNIRGDILASVQGGRLEGVGSIIRTAR